MVQRKTSESFYALLMDHDRRLMSLHGPMADDGSIVDDVCAVRDAGRDITCQAIEKDSLGTATIEAKKLKPTYRIINDVLGSLDNL